MLGPPRGRRSQAVELSTEAALPQSCQITVGDDPSHLSLPDRAHLSPDFQASLRHHRRTEPALSRCLAEPAASAADLVLVGASRSARSAFALALLPRSRAACAPGSNAAACGGESAARGGDAGCFLDDLEQAVDHASLMGALIARPGDPRAARRWSRARRDPQLASSIQYRSHRASVSGRWKVTTGREQGSGSNPSVNMVSSPVDS